ncbi:type II secretion system F family protein [Agromyces sp. CCNWLW203]|uniref:type II secretion system F family protein n=1 Tax=Agromyces sp. CCNWLW203 TaxID=3112842 RepID=UPI002F96B64E
MFGVATGLLALLVLLFFVIAPPAPRVARDRRLAPGTEHVSALTKVTERTTAAVDSAVSRGRGRIFGQEALELAGIHSSPSQFIVVVGSAASVAALVGVVLGLSNGASVFLGLLFLVATPVIAKFVLSVRTGRRQAKFADQIDDTLQLIAGSLRAGHGLTTAVGAVAREAEAPMGEELTRVANEARLGRSLADGMALAAKRMKSDEFDWVAQAVAINTETGGNLSEILLQISTTIRARNEIRRLVAGLSAEGRLSGIILIVLPIALFLLFAFMQPTYLPTFFGSIIGILALILASILMIVGSVWVAAVVRVKF